jgi:hypothetical protein
VTIKWDKQPDAETIERSLVAMFRRGDPRYFSLPCPDCGAPIWFRCTPDVIRQLDDNEMPKPHGGLEDSGHK